MAAATVAAVVGQLASWPAEFVRRVAVCSFQTITFIVGDVAVAAILFRRSASNWINWPEKRDLLSPAYSEELVCRTTRDILGKISAQIPFATSTFCALAAANRKHKITATKHALDDDDDDDDLPSRRC